MLRRLLPLLLLAATPALATPLEDRLREQLVAVTTQLRDAQSQLAAAEAGKAAAEKERDALKAKAGAGDGSSQELAAARAEAEAERRRAAATAAEVTKANGQITELAGKLSAAQAELTAAHAAAAQADARFTAQTASLTDCTDRNGRLVTTANQLIAMYVKRYRDYNFPPLQLARTKVETEAQAMQDKVNSDRIVPNPAPVPQK